MCTANKPEIVGGNLSSRLPATIAWERVRVFHPRVFVYLKTEFKKKKELWGKGAYKQPLVAYTRLLFPNVS